MKITLPPAPEAIRDALRQVIDPEIGVDIVSLGLVYDVAIQGGDVSVTFTLTTRGCPMHSVIRQGVLATVYAVSGVDHVNANLVWEPRWHPGLIEEGAL